LRRANGAPDAFGCRRHVEISDAERAKRVDDGVHDGGKRPDIASLARTLDPQRVGLGRHRVLVGLKGRDFVGARQAVIHQRAGEQLA